MHGLAFGSLGPRTPSSRYPAKASCNTPVRFSADVMSDPHLLLRVQAVVVSLADGTAEGMTDVVELEHIGNDAYSGSWMPRGVGKYRFFFRAWVDEYSTWLHGAERKLRAGVFADLDLKEGEEILSSRLSRYTDMHSRTASLDLDTSLDLDIAQALLSPFLPIVEEENFERVSELVGELRSVADDDELPLERLRDPAVMKLASLPRQEAKVAMSEQLDIEVARSLASASAWYEVFPRSVGGFRGLSSLLPKIAEMGFEVVYLPPIHPIGVTNRKGRNNSLQALKADPGSPWAIGSALGGHDAIEPSLGTMEEFEELIARSKEQGLELALDLALQCSLDHPWVLEHPEWFKHRPDGTIAFAENPPKRYEDVVSIDFLPDNEEDRRALWNAVAQIVLFWLGKGVRIFRVDNPHTKPFGLWEYVISRAKERDPGVIFLAEAFTREKVMYHLGELGFDQSYTYFTWRHSPSEVREYVETLSRPPLSWYFRPNFWPNTPDILPGVLRNGSGAAFALRYVLAATLVSSYGIYSGFEYCENEPFSSKNEEYSNSEKYEIIKRNYDQVSPLGELITKMNGFRRVHKSLTQSANILFMDTSNPHHLAYCRRSADGSDTTVMVVNFDPSGVQEGLLYLPDWLFEQLGAMELIVDDILTGAQYRWGTSEVYIRLDPKVSPAHVVTVRPDR